LVGLSLRSELIAPFGSAVRLRVGPELQWISFVNATLRDQGIDAGGMAIGLAGSLEADLGKTFRVALVYREIHSFLPASDSRFDDIERWLTARIGVQL
jgi:hypothetical protein